MHELDKIRIYVKKVLKREPNDHAQTIVFIFTNRIALGSLKKLTFVTFGGGLGVTAGLSYTLKINLVRFIFL